MASEAAVILTDDQTLDYTQVVRRKLVDDITSNGERMPSDPKDRATLLMTLDGMDRQAISKKRLKTDDKLANGISGIAAATTALIERYGNRSPFEKANERVIESPEHFIEKLVTVPGETEIGLSTMTYQELSDRVGGL